VLPTVSSFCFGPFMFKVIFSRIVSVTYFHRSASLKTTKRFPVDLFIGRVFSGYKKILTGGSSMEKKRFGTLFCIVIIHRSRFSFQMSY